jgi:hypothetical protein
MGHKALKGSKVEIKLRRIKLEIKRLKMKGSISKMEITGGVWKERIMEFLKIPSFNPSSFLTL